MGYDAFKKDIDEAIRVTSANHPAVDTPFNIYTSILNYIDSLKLGKRKSECIKEFVKCFSRENNKNGNPIRSKIESYYSKQGMDIPLEILRILYFHSLQEFSSPNMSTDRKYVSDLFNYITLYESVFLDKNYTADMFNDFLNYILPLVRSYSKSLKIKPVKNNSSIVIKDANYNIGPKIVTNISNGFLLDSFHGSIMKGNIKVASDIGYNKPNKTQQDAVLCMEKDGCSINIVADGTGGGVMSEVASVFTAEELGRWFKSLNIEKYKELSTNNKKEIIKSYKELSNMINYKVSEINKRILQKYPNSSTTLVMALVFPAFTVISNVGDSTAYVLDYDKDELDIVSKIESQTGNLDYESARHNPKNNIVNNVVGYSDYSGVNTKLMFNTSTKKLLLSSDGVTDLISYKNFKRLMRCRSTVAIDFVKRAKYLPDVESISKKMDNISAITIEIDNYNAKRRGI